MLKSENKVTQIYYVGMAFLVLASCTTPGRGLIPPTAATSDTLQPPRTQTVVPSNTPQPAIIPTIDEFANYKPLKGLLTSQVGAFDDPNGFLELPENQSEYCDEIVDQATANADPYLYAAYVVPCGKMGKYKYLAVFNNVGDLNHIDLQLIDLGIDPYCGASFCWDYGKSFPRGLSAGENWQDVDQDGLLDLLFQVSQSGSSHVGVIRTKPDGTMEDMLAAYPFDVSDREFYPLDQSFVPLGYPYDYIDVDGSGFREFVVPDVRWGILSSLRGSLKVSHLYSLVDGKFRDVSTSHPEFYEEAIDRFFKAAAERVKGVSYHRNDPTTNGNAGVDDMFMNVSYPMGGRRTDTDIIAELFEGLLACDVVGRRSECWPVFWEATDLAAPPLHFGYETPEERFYMTNWVKEKRAILAEQYEAGLPFSPNP